MRIMAAPPARYRNCLRVSGPMMRSSIFMYCGTWNCCMYVMRIYEYIRILLITYSHTIRNIRVILLVPYTGHNPGRLPEVWVVPEARWVL